MDEQLRAQPDDLVALMRAGRLTPERMAMAAYLGEARALATGVEPWKPVRRRHRRRLGVDWPARIFVECAPLPPKARVWFAALAAGRALEGWGAASEDAALGHAAVVRWCVGDAGIEDLELLYEAFQRPGAIDDANPSPHTCLRLAVSHALNAAYWSAGGEIPADVDAHGPRGTSRRERVVPLMCGIALAFSSMASDGEHWSSQVVARMPPPDRWPDAPESVAQARAIAAALLDPTWPPWGE